MATVKNNNEEIIPTSNLRFDKLDSIHQALAPRRKEPEQEPEQKLPKFVQDSIGWQGEGRR